MRHRYFLPIVMSGLGWAACDSPAMPAPDVLPSAAQIEAATARDVVATVGTEVSPAPTVRAMDGVGRPMVGIAISFLEETGTGAIGNASVETDVEGLASVGRWTLGPEAGPQRLIAAFEGRPRVVFTATAKAGAAARMTALGGDGQVGSVHAELPQLLRAGVADAFGNPIPGARVMFTVVAGDGNVQDSIALTDSFGVAEAGPWTLGPAAGAQQVRAECGSAHATFLALAYRPPSGLRGELTFASYGVGTNSDIYVIDADGSGLERLTTNGGVDDGPAWSPDGSRIAFVSDREGVPDIYVMAPDGSNVERLTEGAPLSGAYELAWSPSGSAIAFTTLHDGNTGIATVSTADGAVAFLTDVPGFNSQPSWSPDGGLLAFVSDRDAYDFVFNIYTMNADGTDQTLRTDGFGLWPNLPYYLHPAWSPDGSMIAFVHGAIMNTSDMRFKLAVMTPDGTFIKDLAWAGDISWRDLLDPGSLTWSPDGRGIAYTFVDCDLVSRVRCTKVRSVNYVSLDGSEQGRLVSNAYGPSWRR